MSTISLAQVQLINQVAMINKSAAELLLANLQAVPAVAPQLAPQAAVVTPVATLPDVRPNKLSTEQRAEIVRRRLEGEKRWKLANEFGVSTKTIDYTLRKGKINKAVNAKQGRPAIDPIIQRKLQIMYATGGVTRKELAAKFDLSIGTVLRYTPRKRDLKA